MRLAAICFAVGIALVFVAPASAKGIGDFERAAETFFKVPHRETVYVWNNEPCEKTWFCAFYNGGPMHFDLTAWNGMVRSGRCKVYLHEYYHTLQSPPLTEYGEIVAGWEPHADPMFDRIGRAQICKRPPFARAK